MAPDPAWLTLAVVDLAQAIYEDRDWAALPVLADALEEAGCTNRDILDHLRGPERFTRQGKAEEVESTKAQRPVEVAGPCR